MNCYTGNAASGCHYSATRERNRMVVSFVERRVDISFLLLGWNLMIQIIVQSTINRISSVCRP